MSTKVARSKKEAPVVSVPEPVVVPAPEPVVDVEDADKSERESFEDLLEKQLTLIKDGMGLLTQAKAMNQKLRSAHNFELRQQGQRNKKVRKTNVESGILKLAPIPPEAVSFLKSINVAIPENNMLRRTELSGHIYDYVKEHKLYKPDPSKESGFDRKVIIPDVKLRTLFTLSADKTLDFSSINVNLAAIYRRAKEADGESAPAPVAAPAAKAAAAPVKKGKVAGSSA
jgi:chromatin remodeling complex protein RSC6